MMIETLLYINAIIIAVNVGLGWFNLRRYWNGRGDIYFIMACMSFGLIFGALVVTGFALFK